MIRWTAYWNGHFVPEDDIRISPVDRGFIFGDAVYEVTRTYHHRPFRLAWHLDRLYDSLQGIRLDPLIARDKMQALSEEVLRQNLPFIAPTVDLSLTHRVTRGPHRGPFAGAMHGPPTVMITCRPVRFRPFARFYAEGVELQTPPISVPVQGGIDPRIKTHSRLLFALGAVAVAEPDRSVLPLFTDVEGHITETSSTNVFFVRGTQVLTPPDASVLGGITRRVVLDLAAAQGLQPSARHVRLNELDQFDEAFITATSFAILPVRRINAKHFAPIPGPVTTQLTAAFSSLVGLDIPQQAQLAAAAEAGAPKEPPGKIRRVERGSRP